MGSTPAIADEQNLSMLGVGGDRFLSLPPALTAFYVTWDETPNLLTPRGEGKFTHYQIPRTFFSKSGGEMLNSVLYSRQIAAQVFAFSDPNKYTVVLPRINSVLVISDAEPIAYRDNLQRDLSAEIPGNLKVGLKREFHAD